MEPKSIRERAEAAAQQSVQKPQYAAGLVGLVVAGCYMMLLAVFMGLAGVEREAGYAAGVITTAAAFAVPYFYVRAEWKLYHEAVGLEYERLRAELRQGGE